MLSDMLFNLQKKNPLVHSISNYVSANDCANILLACGARPVMADSVEESAEITAKSDGLVINMGTLNPIVLPAMLASGIKANRMGIPVILDPVGVGASTFRMNSAAQLLRDVRFSMIRGNSSELMALIHKTTDSKGVDADKRDGVSEDNMRSLISVIQALSRETGSIIAMSGKIDLVSDHQRCFVVRNGNDMMTRVTGMGCQLSAMMGAYAASNSRSLLEAATAATVAMSVCGELAFERLSEKDGNMSFRNHVIDAVYRLTPDDLERRAVYEIA